MAVGVTIRVTICMSISATISMFGSTFRLVLITC